MIFILGALFVREFPFGKLSMTCHPEPFGFAQDKLHEGSPEELSLLAQLFRDSHLHSICLANRAAQVSPSAQNDINLLMPGTSLYRYHPALKFYQYNDGDLLSILTLWLRSI
jgi:hypothetical protein